MPLPGPPAAAALQWAALFFPALALAFLGWQRRWVADDAFIDLRVVQHLLAGYGPVFNAGERVEAYTSPLWVAILAGGAVLTQTLAGQTPLEWLAAALGLGGAVLGVVASTVGASRGARQVGHTALALPLGALVVVAIPAYWDFASSGLETGLALGWLGATYWAITRTGSEGAPAAVLVGLGPLVRPDLAVMSGAFLLLLLVSLPEWRRRRVAGLLTVAALLPALYQVFRMGYFGAVVPNTALAKEAGTARWDQGWRYLADFIGPYWLWVPLLPLGVWSLWDLAVRLGCRRGHGAAIVAVPVLAGLLHGLYIVRLGGDFMHARMLLPSLFVILLPLTAVAGTRWWHAVLPACVVLPWALVAMLWLRPPYHAVRNGVGPQGIADERRFYVQFSDHAHPVTLADYEAAEWKRDGDGLRIQANRERVLALGFDRPPEEADQAPRTLPLASWVPEDVVADRKSVGMLGYAAGLRVRVVDRLGLADPLGARLRLEQRGRPGHEKSLPEAWVIARYAAPDAVAATERSHPGPVEADAARAALGCGDLAALLEAIQQPLTAARFLSNVALAWRLSVLRVSAEPLQAQAELCSAG